MFLQPGRQRQAIPRSLAGAVKVTPISSRNDPRPPIKFENRTDSGKLSFIDFCVGACSVTIVLSL